MIAPMKEYNWIADFIYTSSAQVQIGQWPIERIRKRPRGFVPEASPPFQIKTKYLIQWLLFSVDTIYWLTFLHLWEFSTNCSINHYTGYRTHYNKSTFQCKKVDHGKKKKKASECKNYFSELTSVLLGSVLINCNIYLL